MIRYFILSFFLGGDLKFLAIVCGIDAANSDHACLWCKCSKGMRSDMEKQWSLTNLEKGARTIEEIGKRSKLGKRNKDRFNCSHEPLFPFILIVRVVILYSYVSLHIRQFNQFTHT